MVIRLGWGNMVSGFLEEDLCKLRELFREDNRGFCLFCSDSKFHSGGKSGHHWGSQNKVEVLLNDPVKGLISFGLGNELVLSLVV